MDKETSMTAAAEAVLFAMGEPVSLQVLARALGTDISTARDVLDNLHESYEAQERGIRLVELEGSYQLCTKPEYYDNLITVAAMPEKPVLTDTVLETLSIVAYRQPVTKAEISRIRGVSSDHAVSRLVEYGLIQEAGRLNAPGRPMLFVTTREFLRRFGMDSLEQLPETGQFMPDRQAEETMDEQTENPVWEKQQENQREKEQTKQEDGI
ncbi:MAG: SMC-Scp complex subunit ScpB [Lachnospiraceae bacterium]|nr:SMC-Scp complex subunit ScpB [Lachnospiraceae bacterium]